MAAKEAHHKGMHHHKKAAHHLHKAHEHLSKMHEHHQKPHKTTAHDRAVDKKNLEKHHHKAK